ncbi:SIMPL domain-containing protein [Simplicispira suum]|uniref:SIMPL domain-containing protein n=2 Tax=Simplicispira suum TaxID=2109915 RepID=A0A2S0MVU7_9BURK|nr:SIMPL domain-containing protein [Simplicispira suum]AVO40005.1 SIMPL domain-containing protein [Simplicispira suum]MBW7834725.1 SIMPL domain-containing protein [Simplicispira suum]
MKTTRSMFASILFFLAACGAAQAQSSLTPAPQNVMQLEASGTVEVQQDVLVLTLGTVKEGKDAALVQTQLRQALDAALQEARRSAEPQKMEVRTGNFSLSPRYGQNQQITGWQGSAELILEGRDFPRITTAAARVSSMTVSRVAFDLSREQRETVERDAQQQAIARFKAQAQQLSAGFGFGGYGLREVAVHSNSSAPGPRPRMMAMEARGASVSSDAQLPVEAGKASVTVTVSGSVQMR